MPDFKLVRYRGKYAAQWNEEGQRKRRSLGTTDLAEARAKLAEIETIKSFKTRPDARTVGDLWPLYIEAKSGLARADTMRHQWKALDPHFAHLAVDGITEQHTDAYSSKRTEAGRAIGTIRGEILLIRQILNWALKKRIINRPSHIEAPSAPEPKDLYLTKDQARQYLKACTTPHIKLFVMLALATAGRKEALLDLEWSRVDFERSRINLRRDSTKKRKGRALVPMNGELRAALQDAKAGALTDYVIEWAGEPVKDVKKGLQGAGRRCGLPWVTAHVFRHTCGVWLAESGKSMSEIAQFLGHSNTSTTEKVYARYSPEYMQGLAESLSLNEPDLVHSHQGSLRKI